MFKVFKTLLEKQRWYLKLRYSKKVLGLWLWFRKDVRSKLAKQKELYEPFLSCASSKIIFDIGANEGFLTQLFVTAGCNVIAVEPSQRNIQILQARFSNFSKVSVLQKAVANKIGYQYFFESNNDYAFGTLSEKWRTLRENNHIKTKPFYLKKHIKISTITLDGLIQQFGIPCFIKIDVEGYEENVLNGLTQKVPMISFEAILPAFITETQNIMEHLCMLEANTQFNYSTNNQMALNNFVTKKEVLKEISALEPQTIEVFAKT